MGVAEKVSHQLIAYVYVPERYQGPDEYRLIQPSSSGKYGKFANFLSHLLFLDKKQKPYEIKFPPIWVKRDERQINLEVSPENRFYLYFFGFNNVFREEVLERFVAMQQANGNPLHSSPEELLEDILNHSGIRISFTHTQS